MTARRTTPTGGATLLAVAIVVAWSCFTARSPDALSFPAEAAPAADRLDPSAWGSDHVDTPVPDYMTGDECLFCHRKKVGPTWSENTHQTTIQLVNRKGAGWTALADGTRTAAMARMVEFVLGQQTHERYLRRAKGYGKLDLLSVGWAVGDEENDGKLVHAGAPSWDGKKFATQCAGCHTTGVDSRKGTFSAISIDCFACHGNVELGHTKDTSLVHLSRKRADPPRVIASLCGQCHIRSGRSKSTSLPFANNFVAGDNLFRDLEVDMSARAIAAMDPGDRHVIQNIRQIVVEGREKVTCLSCHDIHRQSTERHQELEDQDLCFTCHNRNGPRSELRLYERHNSRCGY